MTPLETSLRKLAEAEPGKFQYDWRPDDEPDFRIGKKGWIAIATISQDDLDEIAGLIGWNYDVVGCYYSGKGAPGRYLNEHTGEQFWYYDIWQRQGHRPESSAETYPTKLSAAQSALCAIIEKHLSQ